MFTRGKVVALGSYALEVIRIVLEAVRDVRYALNRHGLRVPMLGLVRLGEPGYDGMGQGAGAGRFRKSLTVKTGGLENVFAGESSEISGERMKGVERTCVARSASDIVGACSL